jgi:hypothetical protein
MALRSGFPVQSVSLIKSGNATSGIACDWKSKRPSYNNDARLMRRGFAFIYIGTIIDQTALGAVPDRLQAELNADMSSAQESREAVVKWQLVPTVNDTNPFAHAHTLSLEDLERSVTF